MNHKARKRIGQNHWGRATLVLCRLPGYSYRYPCAADLISAVSQLVRRFAQEETGASLSFFCTFLRSLLDSVFVLMKIMSKAPLGVALMTVAPIPLRRTIVSFPIILIFGIHLPNS